MPVKKSIRRSTSPRISGLGFVERSRARAVKFAKSVNLASIMKVKKLTNLTTGMDTAVVLPLVGAVVVATVIGTQVSRYNTDESTQATAQADSAIVDGSGVPPVRLSHVELAQNQVAKPAPVTITGCLERDDETFRLKDTSGADAPRSRTWKSAFLKKGSSPVEVVDASKRLKLTSHVGQRVSVTGTLSDGGMQIRSMRRIAASCKNTSSKVIA
jgi:hypothetical protein